MSIPQASSSYNDQENEHILMPPPISPNRLTITMEPKIAPIHLHLTMILRKLFDHPAVIPPFNDGLVAASLVKPLQRIYKGVCMLQDKLHVSQTNVNWLREVQSTCLPKFSHLLFRYNRSTMTSQSHIRGGR